MVSDQRESLGGGGGLGKESRNCKSVCGSTG